MSFLHLSEIHKQPAEKKPDKVLEAMDKNTGWWTVTKTFPILSRIFFGSWYKEINMMDDDTVKTVRGI